MRIALVSKLWEATSPYSTGGTGASVGQLADELVRRGHKVTVFGTGDSKTRARLVAVQPKPFRGNYSEIREYMNLAEAFRRSRDFDIINCHVEHKACFFAPLVKTPTLITLRYGEFFSHEQELFRRNKKLNYSANSPIIKKLLPFLNFKKIILNGLDLDLFPMSDMPENYFLFLGRFSPQKGPDIAIKLAKKMNFKLILAGKTVVRDANFIKKIMPGMKSKSITYIGEIGFRKKVGLLRGARALLAPTRLVEACSNVILEAQACGTPVIAFDAGANKLIVKNKKTGFVVKNEKEMAKAIKKINQIKRQDCRRWIEERFTVERMADEYESVYRRLIRR